MKITVTVRELKDKGSWDKYSEDHGIHPYALNEGLMDYDDEITLTFEEAQKYWILESEL